MWLKDDFEINKILKKVLKKEESRLLYTSEYVHIRKKMKYDYFWSNSNILSGSDLNDWWVDTNNDKTT